MEQIPYIDSFLNWINRKSQSKYYAFYLTLILGLTILFFATPQYLISFPDIFSNSAWDAVMQKSHNLLDPLTNFEPHTHEAKKVFRLTVPFFIKIFHLSPILTYFIQFILGFVLIFLIYKLSFRIIKKSVSATLITACLVFIYFGKACFFDIVTAFDGWAFVFIISTMLCNNFWSVLFFSILTSWTDERAILALPIVAIFHAINTNDFEYNKIQNYFKAKLSKAVIFAIILYIGVRLFLSLTYHLQTPTTELIILIIKSNLSYFGFGILAIFEGLWVVVILTIFFIIKNKNYFLLLIIFLQISILFILSFCVYDVTRSTAYIAPIIFVFIVYLKPLIEVKQLQKILLISTFISFVLPPYYIIRGVNTLTPIYLDVMHFFLNFLNNYIS